MSEEPKKPHVDLSVCCLLTPSQPMCKMLTFVSVCLFLEAKFTPTAVSSTLQSAFSLFKETFPAFSKLIMIFFSLLSHLSKTICCSFPLT